MYLSAADMTSLIESSGGYVILKRLKCIGNYVSGCYEVVEQNRAEITFSGSCCLCLPIHYWATELTFCPNF